MVKTSVHGRQSPPFEASENLGAGVALSRRDNLGAPDPAFGVIVPDLPGCFFAGDTLDEALSAVEEAAAAWIDAALDAGEAIPQPSRLESLQDNPDFRGWVFGVATVNPATLDDPIERVNISLPRRVLSRLNALARAAGQTRWGLISELTLR